jgi:hypothetical protein
MPIGNLTLETQLDLQKAREAVLRALNSKGYKVEEDTQTRIISKHSLGATYYPHKVEINFLPQSGKIILEASIDHNASKTYLERLSKELEKDFSLPQVVYPKLYDISQGEQILWRHDIEKGVIHKEVIAEWMITNQRAMIRIPITSENTIPKVAYVGHSISESVVMNQFRKSQGNRVGNFVGSYSGGGFAGVSSGISSSKSMSYGDLVFLANGKEMFRFRGISDPNGVNRLVKALKKQLLENKKKQQKQPLT